MSEMSEISECITYREELDTYIRISGKRITGSKRKDFLTVLRELTGSEPNDIEWIHSSPAHLYNLKNKMCICGKHIEYPFSIEHFQTKKMFLVGSECIKKFSRRLYKVAKNGSCKHCHSPLPNLRGKYKHLGYCNTDCLSNSEILDFGIYEGKSIYDVDISYITYCYMNMKLTEGKSFLMESLLRNYSRITGIQI